MKTDTEIKEIEKELDNIWTTRKQFTKIKAYMDSLDGVEYICSGTSRLVYKLNNDKVIKLAKNKKGIAQNETEADWLLKNYGVACEWYDVSKDGIWIESEYCTPITQSVFKEKLGYSFKFFQNCLWTYSFDKDGRHYSLKPEGYENTWDTGDLLSCMYSYIGDFDVPVGDLVRISSYGLNHNGEIVLVDTGLNKQVFEQFYRYKESADQLVAYFLESRDQFAAKERPIYCYAKRKHDETGAIRKVSKEPYWVHPEGVAKIVKAYGGNPYEIKLGLAHDLIEDTYVTEPDIEEKFGKHILAGIRELTNDNNAIKKYGKEDYMNHKLVKLSNSALTVKLADIYYNLADYPADAVKERIKHNIEYLVSHRPEFKTIHLDLLDAIYGLF